VTCNLKPYPAQDQQPLIESPCSDGFLFSLLTRSLLRPLINTPQEQIDYHYGFITGKLRTTYYLQIHTLTQVGCNNYCIVKARVGRQSLIFLSRRGGSACHLVALDMEVDTVAAAMFTWRLLLQYLFPKRRQRRENSTPIFARVTPTLK